MNLFRWLARITGISKYFLPCPVAPVAAGTEDALDRAADADDREVARSQAIGEASARAADASQKATTQAMQERQL